MKKTYIKPNLQVELFEVDAIMTEDNTNLINTSSNLLIESIEVEDGVTINLVDTTLNSIDYTQFIK